MVKGGDPALGGGGGSWTSVEQDSKELDDPDQKARYRMFASIIPHTALSKTRN